MCHKVKHIGFATLFFLLLASCMLLDVPLFHDSRIMSKWFGCHAVVLMLSASLFLWCGTCNVHIRLADLAVVAFIIYISLSDYYRGDLDASILLQIASASLLYLIFRQSIEENVLAVCWVLFLLLAVVLAVWGIVQFVLAVIHEQPLHTAVTARFDNPAGFALALALSFPVGIYLLRQPEYIKRQRVCIHVALSVVLIALVLSSSRTGLLSALCMGIYTYGINGKRHRRRELFLMLVLLLACFLYFYKQDSADGRSYIALCTGQQIADTPWWGHGRYGFSAEYMTYQTEYLTSHPGSRFAWLADNTRHPFNEWLYLVVRYGIAGGLLLVVILLSLIPAVKHDMVGKRVLPVGLLVAMLPFTLFSYPMQYPLAWVMLAIAVASLARHTPSVCHLSSRRLIPMFSLLCACSLSPLLYHTIRNEAVWYDVASRSLSGQTRYVMPRYEELYTRMKHSPHFLYNYAAELNYIGEYHRSQQILDECTRRMCDYDTHLLAASNHEHMGNYGLAEAHLCKAAAMCPVRFVPLYQLAKLYGKMGRSEEQRQLAQLIMDKEVKVPSQRITEIKDEMRYILEETDFK